MTEAKYETIYHLGAIRQVVEAFWERFGGYRVFAFDAEMGAGKTSFINALCQYLGVRDAVSSPTFALINEYRFQRQGKEQVIFHMDWYRLKSSEEAIQAGIEDSLHQPGAIAFVEWPEKAEELLPRPYVKVQLEYTEPEERRLSATVTH